MKRKRLLLIVGCLAAVLLAGYATLPRQHRITIENIGAIRDGMTERQVETILGAPAGDYSSGVLFDMVTTQMTGSELMEKHGGKVWVGVNGGIWIRFDERGKAVIRMSVSGPVRESFFAKLRRWLGM
jgi:hypothetical protein